MDVLVSRGEAIKVPDLSGMDKEKAEKALKKAGLQMAVSGESFSDTIKAGGIISQDPEPKTECEQDDTVSVVVSKGITQVKVPDMTGMTEDEAVAALKAAKLKAEAVYDYNDSVDAGKVFDQSVAGGKETDINSTVTIKVSNGSAPKPAKTTAKKSSKKTKKKKRKKESVDLIY